MESPPTEIWASKYETRYIRADVVEMELNNLREDLLSRAATENSRKSAARARGAGIAIHIGAECVYRECAEKISKLLKFYFKKD